MHTFQPAKESLFGSLWNPGLTVPARQSLSQQGGFTSKSRPNLLLNGLDNENAEFSQPLAENHICTAQKHVPSFLYGTSGAGKMQTVFEYLSKNKGFADDFMRNPGSNDLVNSLDCNLQMAGNDTRISEQNRIRIHNRVSMLLFIRYVVHEKLEARFKERLKRGMNPYEWLLYQIFPELFLGKDVFPATVEGSIGPKRT
ncbi:hypothetical protein SEMRO_595_G172570.1 [Seminavis robusta]|uniref:Uncharacterized protein n=1 Tax=Seminavis robusta TaxID=568900 RepID=A0A9N8E6A5_9STRA|nr:hypothetical protein SEMRO_595_G172570.1 [Seminavis robusta]|eukprot:Sro595_g172570.1 n/a (199) ;mRNA; f:483-1079